MSASPTTSASPDSLSSSPNDRFGPVENARALEILADVCDQISVAMGSHIRTQPRIRPVANPGGSLIEPMKE